MYTTILVEFGWMLLLLKAVVALFTMDCFFSGHLSEIALHTWHAKKFLEGEIVIYKHSHKKSGVAYGDGLTDLESKYISMSKTSKLPKSFRVRSWPPEIVNYRS